MAQVDVTQPKYDIEDQGRPIRRSNHVAAIYGGCMIVHGGLQGEMGQVLDDVALFDIALGMWLRFKKPKRCLTRLGGRQQHTLTSVVDYKIDAAQRDTRLMWIQSPSDLIKNGSKAFNQSGLFLFGGLNSRNQPKNDLFLITPHFERNKKYLTIEKANFKKSVKPTICYDVVKL